MSSLLCTGCTIRRPAPRSRYCTECQWALNSHVTVVWGAPCSGKTTKAIELFKTGGIIVDVDQLSQALTLNAYERTDDQLPFVLEAYDAVLAKLRKPHSLHCAIVVGCLPEKEARSRFAGATLIHMDADAETCKARARLAKRPRSWTQAIDRYFERVEL